VTHQVSDHAHNLVALRNVEAVSFVIVQQYGGNMRLLLKSLIAASFFTSAAYAQTPSQNGPQNPAIKGMHDNNSSTPVGGANSFTMNEAKSQIEAKGYTHVTGLKKGSDGVWRGKATKDSQAGPVSVDYQGNVN
jgi:hypothetical protein